MSKREIAAQVLGNPIAARICSPILTSRGALRILAYHRILDDDPNRFPFDEALISACTESFREQMKFVRRNFDVVSFRDLLACELEGRPWPRRAAIVTFDDGYRDNYTNAFPVLREFSLPATIFLTTGHISQSKLFWWDRVAYIIKQTERRSAIFSDVSSMPFDLGSGAARRRSIGRVLWWLKQVADDVRSSFIERLAAELEVTVPEDVAAGMHLSWDEVKEMARSRMEFGSHTITHPILSHVGETRLGEEISQSKRSLEQHLGREVIAFAYPAGRRTRFNNRVQSVVADAGYRFAVSYEEGVAIEGACDRFAMPRIHVEGDESMSLFRANLLFPNLMLSQKGQGAAREELASAPSVSL